MKRKWPTVPGILARAASIEVRGVSASYRDRESGELVKIHGATVPLLVKSIHFDWPRVSDWSRTIYTRPQGDRE